MSSTTLSSSTMPHSPSITITSGASRLRLRSIGAKLAAGFGVLLVSLLVVAGVALIGLGQLSNGEHLLSQNLDRIYRLGQIQANWNRLRADGLQVLIDRRTGQNTAHDRAVVANTEATITRQSGLLALELSGSDLTQLRRFDALNRQLFASLSSDINLNNSQIAIRAFEHTNASLGHKGESQLVALGSQLRARAFARQTADRHTRQRLMWIVSGIGLIALVAGFVTARRLTRSITVPVGLLNQTATRVGSGDFSQSVDVMPTGDEIENLARSFATMVDNLRTLIRTVNESAQTVAAHSEELSAMAEEASQATNQVATAVGEITQGTISHTEGVSSISRAMTELRQAIDQVATGAQTQADQVNQAAQAVTTATQAVETMQMVVGTVADAAARMKAAAAAGREKVAGTVQGIVQVHRTILDTAGAIESLEAQSSQIHGMVQAIREIADQTNLLSLNANIEAARAGEAGKGFAVVADEVRQLAERSRQASQEVVQLVDNIRQGIAAAVTAMHQATASGEQGQQLAEEAGQALESITQEVTQTVEAITRIEDAMNATKHHTIALLPLMDSVSSVTEENAAMAHQMTANGANVTDNLNQLAAVGQENAASAEEVSAATEQLTASIQQFAESAHGLAQMGQELQRSITQFRV
ncbi:methyl-accepting chemotaxis sensory transducer [Sulfobacillus acidophilus DSM 10332]|uniref:Methyl-accepting chemotaxis sensory transducer n=1 Tax=Sulfobacillus acidophilus (strain ATCC 700253 / DSM 10332 / NAL) TaxID=679936 RepID=G8TY66_SULAD|nr:methyl-accepting chemotaxis sensory transducer [Sulfobacillus acidophilus DSM 10332]